MTKPKPPPTKCGKGHELRGDNLIVYTRNHPTGPRRLYACRTCQSQQGRRGAVLPGAVQAVIDRYDTEILRLTDCMDLATHAEIAMLRKRIKWIERQKDKLHASYRVED